MLWVVWWMYDGFAWLSNNVGPTTTSTRVPMLVAMAGFLVLAIAVPEAFGEDRWLFAWAYLLTGIVHSVSFLRSSLGGSARAILTIAPINLGICLGLFLAAAFPRTGAGSAGRWPRGCRWSRSCAGSRAGSRSGPHTSRSGTA